MYCMWQASLKAFCGIVKLMMQDSGCSSAHSYKKFLCKMNFPSIPNKCLHIMNQNLNGKIINKTRSSSGFSVFCTFNITEWSEQNVANNC